MMLHTVLLASYNPTSDFISCCLSLCLIITYPVQTKTQALAMATKNIGTRKAPKNTPALLMKQLERERDRSG